MSRIALILSLLLPAIAAAQGDPSLASYRVSIQGQAGSGTGITPFIAVTNVHVIRRLGEHARLKHPITGRQWEGDVVATDPAADVALIFIASGDLSWAAIGDDPQPGQPCTLLGYGGDGVLKRGDGRFLRAERHRGQGVPVWNAAVESISGDSGSGLFDAQGRLASVNWGGTHGSNVSASTPASYVARLYQRWLGSLSPEQTQLFGGMCQGGQCQPPGGGYGGGGGVMPPKQPVQPPQWQPPQWPPPWQQPQQPPQWQQPMAPLWPPASPAPQQPIAGPVPPLVPIPPPPAKPGIPAEDLPKLADEIAAALDKRRGGKPKDEPKPDSPAVEVDLDELAKRVADRLPPIYVDAYVDGQKVKSEKVRLGEVLNLHHGRSKPK